ncbi:MAG TPA: MBL fold metallo-hydrolase [Verrucomicrobiae bacterium]
MTVSTYLQHPTVARAGTSSLSNAGWLALRFLDLPGRTLMTGLICACLLTQTRAALPQSDGSEFVDLEKLSDRVVLAYWVGMDRRCNLTAIRTVKGLVIIDTEMSPRIVGPIKEKLERTFGRSDWVYVINTHAHDNHPGGNSLFKGAVIVGHQNLPGDMQWIVRRQTEPEWKNREIERADKYMQSLRAGLPRMAGRSAEETRMAREEIKFWEFHTQDLREGYAVVKPSLTFTNERTLDLGDVQLELVFFGRGHSLSDTLVYIPQEKLLVSGGILYQRAHFPEIGEQSTLEDVRRFLTVLDRFLALDVQIDHVVPAHSPPLLKSDLTPVRDYYQRMLAGVQTAQRQGLTLDQAKPRLAATRFPAFRDRPPGVWSHGMHERNLRNLWRIVQEKQ